ncbi:TldD/PmbA family protein [Persephonella sp.]|uniref:TldD/PmbA family protein n=2 Tax=Persephonella sp. TaxID=2060922 RepID=UPI0025E471DA|nr:TldD/PmbA family protein [Persephonella sp.]
MELKNIIQKNLDLLNGVEWEFYLIEKTTLKSRSKDFQIESITKSGEKGLSIRLKKDGKVGFSYVSNISDDTVKKGIQKAKDILKISTPDDAIFFQKPVETDLIPEAYDTFSTERLDTKEKILKATEIERAIKTKDNRIKNVRDCTFSETVFSYSLINYKGLDISEKGTVYTAMASAVAEDKGDSQIAWGFTQSRYLEDLDINRLADEIVSGAVSLLGGKPVPTTSLPVLFPPYSFSQILEAFFQAFSGEFLIKGKSYFDDKKDQKVAPSFISIVDDGRLTHGIMTRNFDDEGSPTQKTQIIKDGVFKNFIHNTYTAKLSGEKSTGNGFKATFKEPPQVYPSNFYLQKGTGIKIESKTFKVIQLLGLHTANPVTGDFSVGASGALIDGKGFSQPVTGVTLSGNFFQMLKDIIQVGDDLRFYGNFGSPSVLVEKMVLGGI